MQTIIYKVNTQQGPTVCIYPYADMSELYPYAIQYTNHSLYPVISHNKNIKTIKNKYIYICITGASLVAQTVKNPPAMQKTWVQSLGWKDPLEKGMAVHSSILAWRIPWTEEPGGLQSTGSQRVGYN